MSFAGAGVGLLTPHRLPADGERHVSGTPPTSPPPVPEADEGKFRRPRLLTPVPFDPTALPPYTSRTQDARDELQKCSKEAFCRRASPVR